MPTIEGMEPTTTQAASAAVHPATASLAVANCFLVVDDHDKALAFYRDVLGFTVTNDVSQGEYRWLSVSPPGQPELEVVIQSVGIYPGSSDDDRSAMDTLPPTSGRVGKSSAVRPWMR